MYHRFINKIAGVDIREKKDIGVALDRPVGCAFMFCRFRINGKIKGKRAVHDTVGDLPVFVHAGEFRRFHGDGHLRIDYFHSGEGSYFRTFDAAGFRDFQCIVNVMYLFSEPIHGIKVCPF